MEKIDRFYKNIQTKTSWGTKDLLPKIQSLKESLVQEFAEANRVDVYRSSKTISVDTIGRYDILYLPVVGTIHYFMIYKVNHDSVIGVILSSKDKVHSIHKIEEDRFFTNTYATNTFATIPIAEAYKSFVRVFESKDEANLIFKKIEMYYKQLFNPNVRAFRTTATRITNVQAPAATIELSTTQELVSIESTSQVDNNTTEHG